MKTEREGQMTEPAPILNMPAALSGHELPTVGP
jgi:hypothetical protein